MPRQPKLKQVSTSKAFTAPLASLPSPEAYATFDGASHYIQRRTTFGDVDTNIGPRRARYHFASLWLRATAYVVAGRQNIFAVGTGAGINTRSLGIRWQVDGKIQTNMKYGQYYDGSWNDDGIQYILIGCDDVIMTNVIPLNRWNHIAVFADYGDGSLSPPEDATYSAYINGVKETLTNTLSPTERNTTTYTDEFSATEPTISDVCVVGGNQYPDPPGHTFTGDLGDVLYHCWDHDAHPPGFDPDYWVEQLGLGQPLGDGSNYFWTRPYLLLNDTSDLRTNHGTGGAFTGSIA